MVFINYEKWENLLPEMSKAYSSANPFPHIIIDNFLESDSANRITEEFPKIDSGEWINYLHINENKYGKNKVENLSTNIKSLLKDLNSERLIKFLSTLSGINNLLPDYSYEGGGLHQSKRGGFLNIHTDFTVHPHNMNWRRKLNLLIYFNKEWKDSYGGHLELWDKKMKKCVQKILPIFNRAVIFTTDEFSWHGHPHPMTCPEDETRKSIALYYFAEEKKPLIRATCYKPLPEDNPSKKFLIRADNMALKAYDKIKRTFNLSDDFASKILGLLNKK